MKIRLDKYLAEMGKGSRQDVKKLIRQKQVTVNGDVVTKPEMKVDTDTDRVVMQEEEISFVAFEYYMLNKPAGVVSACRDKREKTVLDCLGATNRKGLFPVGRLDKDTEGLLLITNDGELAHRLLSPSHHVPKRYYAEVTGTLPEDIGESFQKGVNIGTGEEEEWTSPASLDILEVGEVSRVYLTICEGKYHQVKRMFLSCGCRVIYLKRESMGSLILDETLKPGESRPLTREEIRELGGHHADKY